MLRVGFVVAFVLFCPVTCCRIPSPGYHSFLCICCLSVRIGSCPSHGAMRPSWPSTHGCGCGAWVTEPNRESAGRFGDHPRHGAICPIPPDHEPTRLFFKKTLDAYAAALGHVRLLEGWTNNLAAALQQ